MCFRSLAAVGPSGLIPRFVPWEGCFVFVEVKVFGTFGRTDLTSPRRWCCIPCSSSLSCGLVVNE